MIRGIRQGIPSGYMLGRVSAGTGAVELVHLGSLTDQVISSGNVLTAGGANPQNWLVGSVTDLVGSSLSNGTLTTDWNAGTVTAVNGGTVNAGTLAMDWEAGKVNILVGATVATGTLTTDWDAGKVTALGTGVTLTSGTLTASGAAQEWSAGTVTAIGTGVTITSGTISASGGGGGGGGALFNLLAPPTALGGAGQNPGYTATAFTLSNTITLSAMYMPVADITAGNTFVAGVAPVNSGYTLTANPSLTNTYVAPSSVGSTSFTLDFASAVTLAPGNYVALLGCLNSGGFNNYYEATATQHQLEFFAPGFANLALNGGLPIGIGYGATLVSGTTPAATFSQDPSTMGLLYTVTPTA